MITGVETAGVVLGTLPLLISALEHYPDMIRPTREFIRWKVHKNRLVQELYTLRASFHQAMDILLQPLTEPDELTAMIEDPRSDLWTSGPIADHLRDALGPTYIPLILTIRDIDEILISIVGHLNIEGSQQTTIQLSHVIEANPPLVNGPQSPRTFEFGKRIAFTMRKSDIKTSLERLDGCTRRVDSWIERAGRSQTSQPVFRSRLSFAHPPSTVRRNASKMHGALSRSWCRARPQHPTYLLLEHRLKRPRRAKGHREQNSREVSQANCFKLSIRGECCVHIPQFNTEFRVVEPVVRSSSIRRARVSLSVIPPETSQEANPYDDPSLLPRVEEFCRYLQQPTHARAGFCLDHDEALRTYPCECVTTRYLDHTTTLEALLLSAKSRLPLASKYALAITLVASTLQLNHTPWLDGGWTKSDIAFLKASGQSVPTADLEYPYLVQKFTNSVASNANKVTDRAKILALTIMLLEINLGKTIEEVQIPEDQGKGGTYDEAAKFKTANRWFQTENPGMNPGFSKAILGGLQEYLNPDANLDNPEYCDHIIEKILQPLDDEMAMIRRAP